jgi:autotransporter translocation and assembly factor TamB
LKRIIKVVSIFVGLGVLLILALMLWQPDRLKRQLLGYGLESFNRQSPYEIQVNAVTGNVFRSLTLIDVSVRIKSSGEKLATVSQTQIDFGWRALFQKRLEFSAITLRNPLIILHLNEQNQLVLPKSQSNRRQRSGVTIHALKIDSGKIKVIRAHGSTLTLSEIQSNLALEGPEIELKNASLRVAGGTIQSSGKVEMAGTQAMKFRVNCENLQIDRIVRWAQGRPNGFKLNYSGRTDFNGNSKKWALTTDGQLNHAPLKMSVSQGESVLSGQIILAGANMASLGFPQAAQHSIWVDAKFGNVSKAIEKIDLDGQISIKDQGNDQPWTSARLALKHGIGDVKGNFSLPGIKAVLDGKIDLPHQHGNGTWQLHADQFSELAPWWPGARNLSGLIEGSGTFSTKDGKKWRIAGKANGEKIRYQELRVASLSAEFVFDPGRRTELSLSSTHIKRGETDTSLDIAAFSLGLKQNASDPWDCNVSVKFQNEAALTLRATIERKREEWVATLSSLNLQIPRQTAPWHLKHDASLAFRSGRWAVQDLELVRDNDFLRIPRLVSLDGRLKGSAEWQLDPEFFNLFLNRGIQSGGQTRLDVDIAGRWPELGVNGKLSGNIPKIDIKAAGLQLRDLKFGIKFDSTTVLVETFVAQLQKGQLALTGSAHNSLLDFDLRSHGLSIQTDAIKAKGDVNIHLGGRFDAPSVTGDIRLVKAVYDYGNQRKQAKKKKKGDNKDEPASSKNSAPPAWWVQTQMDVNARWERDVWYRDGITGIETQADVRIQKIPGTSTVFLTGQVSSLQGRYAYYGKEFEIESGLIQFTGPPEINPLLNVQASYQADPTIVYLTVTGTAKQPVLKMTSNPPLPEQDIVSILVFGRPLSELNTAAGGGTNQEMASMAGSVLGSYVTRGLRQTGIEHLDLDVLNVQSTEQGNQVTVGRYVTRNLFVSYGQTISATGSKGFAADYYIGRHWVIEGAAGSPNLSHLDVLFRYPLNAFASRGLGPLRQSPFRNSLDRPDLTPSAISPQ